MLTLYRALAGDANGRVVLAWTGPRDGAFAAGSLALRATEDTIRRALGRRWTVAARLAFWNLLAPWHLASRLDWERIIPREGAGYVLTLGATPGSAVRGRAILASLEEELVAGGAQELWVDTEASNERALTLYARAGYAVRARRLGQVLLSKPAT